MPTGRVKWFDNRKGFGFILGETGEDIFIHYSVIKTEGFRTLNDGELVRYEIVQGPKGLLARDVQRVIEDGSHGGHGAAAGGAGPVAGSTGGDALRRAERFFESGGSTER